MRTDDLIRGLSADLATRPPLSRGVIVAIAAGGLIAAIVLQMWLGVRPDALRALETWRFVAKFVVTISLAAAAAVLLLGLLRPGADTASRRIALIAPAVFITAAVLAELAGVPADRWMPRAIGQNASTCLTAIPLLSIVPLMALLAAARAGAPASPAGAGAIAGLVAGAIAATLYGAHCIDDSPLFVAIWYALAIALVAGVGAIAGRFLLRW